MLPCADVVLSGSTYQAGRRIMTYKSAPSALWQFLQPFSLGVWLLMFASAVVVALVLTLLETPWASQAPDAGSAHAAHADIRPWQQLLCNYWQRWV